MDRLAISREGVTSAAFQNLRAQFEIMTTADPAKGLEARRLIFTLSGKPGFEALAGRLEEVLTELERCLINGDAKAFVETRREACLRTVDSVIRRLSED